MGIDVNEINIWTDYRRGDIKAFEGLYNIYYTKLTNYGYRFTNDSQYVEYAIQDLFVKLWKNRKTIQDTTSVKNYLYTSFRRTLIRHIQRSEEVLPFDEQKQEIEFGFELSPESALIGRERLLEIQNRLSAAMAAMNPRQREVIFLKYYEDLNYEEIAEILGITVKGTYKLMYRAMDALKSNLSNFMLMVLYAVVIKARG